MHYEYEFVKHQQGLPFRAYFVSVSEVAFHWHSDFEIMWVLRGNVKIQSKNGVQSLGKGDLYIINAYDFHSLQSDDADNLLLGLQVDPSLVKDYLWSLTELDFSQSHIEDREGVSEIFHGLMANIMYLIREGSEVSILRAVSDLYRLISEVVHQLPYESLSHQRVQIKSNDFSRIQGIVTYVNEHYEEKITLQTLADEYYLSRYHLSHFVKRKLGINLQTFINNVRLNHAVRLLCYSKNSVVDVAESTGFSDVKYLTRLVKEKYRMTPSQLRKQHRVGEASGAIVEKDGHRIFDLEDAYKWLDSYIT